MLRRLAVTSAAAAAVLASGSVAAAREPSSRLFVLAQSTESPGFRTEPYGDVAELADGGLLVATGLPDASIHRLAVDGERTQVQLPVPGADDFWRPRDVLPQADGSIIVADHSTISHISAAGEPRRLAGTGVCRFSGDGGPATRADMCLPAGLARTGDGDVLFADTTSSRIRRIASDGTISTVAGPAIPCATGLEWRVGDRATGREGGIGDGPDGGNPTLRALAHA